MEIRTENENYRYTEYLESAIGKVQEAISNISYSSYPNINKDAIKQLEKAIDLMEYGLIRNIYKP